jgi:uncharacterized protein (TIGR03083 family)
MSSLADRTIEAQRATQDRLAKLVTGLSDLDLTHPSGSSDWTVAQVLSHLGSAAEIGLGTLRAAPAADERPPGANEAVWDRWNAMSPREQANGFLLTSEAIVAAYDALDADQREHLTAPLSFLPEPAGVALLAGLRLNEIALHGWDVEVAFDPEATIPDDVAAVLLEQHRGPITFMLGFTAKTASLGGRSLRLAVNATRPNASCGLLLGEQAALGDAPVNPDGVLQLPTEALIRLVTGRLTPEHTPAGVEVTGALSIDELRAVFPGF